MSSTVKTPADIDGFIQKLSAKEKMKLAHKLERQTRRQRWAPLLDRIQKRAAKKPVNEKDILAIVKEANRELRGQGRH